MCNNDFNPIGTVTYNPWDGQYLYQEEYHNGTSK